MPKRTQKARRRPDRTHTKRLRRRIAEAIAEKISHGRLGIDTLAQRLSCTPSQLYDVKAGRIENATLDRLIGYASGLGLRIGLTVDGKKA